MKVFYVRRDGRTLFLIGHFNEDELIELKREGYKERIVSGQ